MAHKPRPTFAALLATLLKDRGLTAYRLAEDAGLSRQAIAKLLAGSAPSWETVQRIAAALGVSTEALRDR
jgi:transcriptional regulator with XRE-family HTH domain